MLLEHFNLTQLILSADRDERELGVEFSLLLFRFDEGTNLADISSNAVAQQIIMKKETQDVW